MAVCTSLEQRQMDMVKQTMKRLGGKHVRGFQPGRTTHVITTSEQGKKCPRTIKYLRGIASGRWIVSIDWISACLAAGKFVSEQPYELSAALECSIWEDVPKRARETMLASEGLQRVLSGITVCFLGNFFSPTISELSQLAGEAGATVVPLRSDGSLRPQRPCTFAIIDKSDRQANIATLARLRSTVATNADDDDDDDEDVHAKGSASQPKGSRPCWFEHVVGVDWLLDSICKYDVCAVDGYDVVHSSSITRDASVASIKSDSERAVGLSACLSF